MICDDISDYAVLFSVPCIYIGPPPPPLNAKTPWRALRSPLDHPFLPFCRSVCDYTPTRATKLPIHLCKPPGVPSFVRPTRYVSISRGSDVVPSSIPAQLSGSTQSKFPAGDDPSRPALHTRRREILSGLMNTRIRSDCSRGAGRSPIPGFPGFCIS